MGKLVGKEWGQFDFEYNPRSRQPDFDPSIKAVLSHLLGYFPGGAKFVRLLCDTDGRLLVTSGASKTDVGVTSQVNVGVGTFTLLANNPTRRAYAITNLGTLTIFIHFGNTTSLATDFPILPNQTFADDTYTGIISAGTTGGTQDVRVLEF